MDNFKLFLSKSFYELVFYDDLTSETWEYYSNEILKCIDDI